MAKCIKVRATYWKKAAYFGVAGNEIEGQNKNNRISQKHARSCSWAVATGEQAHEHPMLRESSKGAVHS